MNTVTNVNFDDAAMEEEVPGIYEFYVNYINATLKVISAKNNMHKTNFHNGVTQLKAAAKKGSEEANNLLLELYQVGLVGR